MVDRTFLRVGLLIPIWLLLGVSLTALGYPGYSHLDHAMSQLGAIGAPTQGFSAWVNNLPLGGLFLTFGIGIWRRYLHSRLAKFTALLVMLHGVASLATGYFPCDQGCAPELPSLSQQLHNLAGLVMFLSLTLASAVWIGLAKRLLGSLAFAGFSLTCTVLAIGTVVMMAEAMEAGRLFGLYQRLNYGVAVIWCAGLAWMSLRRSRPRVRAG
jgi:hypothetical membrane protein